ncbi:MAG: sulfotransferase, partial [Bacteroidota bacterium]
MAAEDAKFKLPDISTLAGASLWIYLRAIVGRKVHPRYYLKIFITFLIILLSLPFRLYENLKFYLPLRRFQMKKPPIFIIGHWRSGTTHLHNVLCKDPQAAYLTTYMSLFPEALGTKVIFKNFMRWVMPKKRPSDNVKLAVDFPQEDEFALGNIHPYCYYYFFHFPFDYQEYYQDYVLFKGKEKIKKSWKKTYKHLISKSIMNTQGERAIFKNPVNTARIPALLELFPQARFIYIFRNPIIVYLSTKKFFVELFPTLQFQQVSEEEISD